MDGQQAAALTQAIQALAAALVNPPPPPAPPASPAGPAAPAPTQVSPYEGGALYLTSCTGTSLFHSGAKELDAKFTGKVDNLHVFLNNLHNRAKMCYWIGSAHNILTIQVAGQSLNLLDHYGQISTTDVKAACQTRIAAGAPLHSKQNAKTMYQCLTKSVLGDAKSKLATVTTKFHEDGPTLLHHLVTNLLTSTFSSAQATREQLSAFHPKRVKYDIPEVNAYIQSAVKTLHSAGTTTTTITNAEILYYQFKIYKKIKSPAEWTAKLLFLENVAASTPN